MAHYVPSLEWSARALQVRQFVFDFWAEQGRAPNLRQVGEGTGLLRREIVQAYKELQTGIVVVVDQDSPNCEPLLAKNVRGIPPPFCLFPTLLFHVLEKKGLHNIF